MTGIIGAMEEECTLLRSWMSEPLQRRRGPFTFVEGRLSGEPVVLLRCGIGKVNAAAGCALLCDHWKPGLVINTGSAGGLDPSLKVGDIVIASGLVHHDVDVTAFGYKIGQVPQMDAVFTVDPALCGLAEAAVDTLKAEGLLPAALNHTRGIIASADAFVSEEAQLERLRRLFPEAKAVEMEAAALAQTATLFKTPFLVLRALSDIAGKESPLTFDQFLPLAAANSARLVERLVHLRAPGGEVEGGK